MNENEIMDARKWIEFGKMFNNMVQEGWEVSLDSLVIGDQTTVYNVCAVNDEGELLEYNGDHDSPYLAIKDFYFHYFFDEEMDSIEFNLPDVDLEKLYNMSDKEGITIDEMIGKILMEILPISKEEEGEDCDCDYCSFAPDPNIEEAKCCFNCKFIKISNIYPDDIRCTYHKIITLNNNTCPFFISSNDNPF